MGEARKRKTSSEDKSNGSNSPTEVKVIEKSGGLGLISVVLISAILAGSGCHVLKKDTQENINELNKFITTLKAENTATASLVQNLRDAISTKDSLIDSLRKDIGANEEQTKQTDKKMDAIIEELKTAESASQGRTDKIKDLEAQLAAAKADAESKIDNLNALVSALPSGIQDDMAKQGIEIEGFGSKIAALDSRVNEQDAKLAETAKVAANVPDIQGLMSEIVSGLQSQIESLKGDVIEASSKIPSEVTLVTIKDQAEKASTGLKQALDQLTQHTKDINTLRSAGEKQISGLSDSVQTLTNDSVEYSSSISKMTSELESAQALLKALSNDIDAIKKRQADIAKGA
jgi:chromosome segregation ATPase